MACWILFALRQLVRIPGAFVLRNDFVFPRSGICDHDGADAFERAERVGDEVLELGIRSSL